MSHWQPVDEGSSRRYRQVAIVAIAVFVAIIVVAGIALLMTVLVVNPLGG